MSHYGAVSHALHMAVACARSTGKGRAGRANMCAGMWAVRATKGAGQVENRHVHEQQYLQQAAVGGIKTPEGEAEPAASMADIVAQAVSETHNGWLPSSHERYWSEPLMPDHQAGLGKYRRQWTEEVESPRGTGYGEGARPFAKGSANHEVVPLSGDDVDDLAVRTVAGCLAAFPQVSLDARVAAGSSSMLRQAIALRTPSYSSPSARCRLAAPQLAGTSLAEAYLETVYGK